mgnify:CR=1 FL=1
MPDAVRFVIVDYLRCVQIGDLSAPSFSSFLMIVLMILTILLASHGTIWSHNERWVKLFVVVIVACVRKTVC